MNEYMTYLMLFVFVRISIHHVVFVCKLSTNEMTAVEAILISLVPGMGLEPISQEGRGF